jgi:hypothetical protein
LLGIASAGLLLGITAALKKQELALVAKMESGGGKEGSNTNTVGIRHHKDSPEDLQWVRSLFIAIM